MLFIAGIDEAGRGPLAGPVTAACVVLPSSFTNSEITDSKKLTTVQRERLYGEIINIATAYSVISVGSKRIDVINIREATRLAMRLCAEKVYLALLKGTPKKYVEPSCLPVLHILIDGNTAIETSFTQETIIKGDEKIVSISAASILAKVTRDRLMVKLGQLYPDYDLAGHKGYSTQFHREAIKRKGPSKIHRLNFAGVREFVRKDQVVFQELVSSFSGDQLPVDISFTDSPAPSP